MVQTLDLNLGKTLTCIGSGSEKRDTKKKIDINQYLYSIFTGLPES